MEQARHDVPSNMFVLPCEFVQFFFAVFGNERCEHEMSVCESGGGEIVVVE